jgi:hypothetical protein
MEGKEIAKRGLEATGKAAAGIGKYFISNKPRFRMASSHVGNHDDSIDKTKMGLYMPTNMRDMHSTKKLRRPRLF